MPLSDCLAYSRYLALFDECGDHSLTKINPEFPLFVLCVFAAERKLYAREIVPAIADFKLRYFPHEGINLHSRDIRRASGPFSILQNATIRARFLDELTSLIAGLRFEIFATAINKRECAITGDLRTTNPYAIALRSGFERVLRFLQDSGEHRLPVIAEARGHAEDDALRLAFNDFLAIRDAQRENAGKPVCPMSFRRKHENIAGIQLADLCAHPIARHLLDPSAPNRAFDAVAPHMRDWKLEAGEFVLLK